MNRTLLRAATAAVILVTAPSVASGQHQKKNIKLHVDTRWSECAFQLDSTLTQAAWRQFAEEAGVAAYLRPLTDARPLGKGTVEVSLLRWGTAIDDADAAWNDTFVHPDEEHWLIDGTRLQIPGIMVRVGVDDRTDLGGYITKNPSSNYGFVGGHVQYNFVKDEGRSWAAAGRLSAVSLFGPDDLDFAILGMDFLASRAFPVNPWLTVSPYAGFSSFLPYAREKSPLVDLDDEIVPGSQAMVGAVAQVYRTRLALEFTTAAVQTVSMKVGVAF